MGYESNYILERADPEYVLVANGVTLGQRKRNSIEMLCPCPEHDDKKYGNCSYNLKDRYWHCFACNRGGTLIDIVMMRHGWDTKDGKKAYDAMREICSLCGIECPGITDKNFKPHLMPPLLTGDDLKLLGISDEPMTYISPEEEKDDPFAEENVVEYRPFTRMRTEDEDSYCAVVLAKSQAIIHEYRMRIALEYILMSNGNYSEINESMIKHYLTRNLDHARRIFYAFVEYQKKKTGEKNYDGGKRKGRGNSPQKPVQK